MTKDYERILMMGREGTGKTRTHISLAKWLRPAGVKMWVMDTDRAMTRMLSGDFRELDAAHGGNINVLPCDEWPDYLKALETIDRRCSDGDWVVVDMVSYAWDAVQQYFIDQVFEKSRGDYFLEVRKSMRATKTTSKGGLKVLEGWKDWPVINGLYFDWMTPILRKLPCHIFFTASVTALGDQEDEITRATYGPYGVKPAGQKNLGHQAHTVLLATQKADGWHLTSLKDRERRLLDNQRIVSFPVQYLMQVGGWKGPGQ